MIGIFIEVKPEAGLIFWFGRVTRSVGRAEARLSSLAIGVKLGWRNFWPQLGATGTIKRMITVDSADVVKDLLLRSTSCESNDFAILTIQSESSTQLASSIFEPSADMAVTCTVGLLVRFDLKIIQLPV